MNTDRDAQTPDFRAKRVPPAGWCSIASGPDELSLDTVDEETWRGLVALSDDVSLRTSAHHGTALKQAYTVQGNWTSLVLDIQDLASDPRTDPLAVAALGASEEFQASINLALTGFYRQAIGTLRAVPESMLAALDFATRDDPEAISAWLAGANDGTFRATHVRRRLSRREPFGHLATAEWSLFGDDGWFAWLYQFLCAFVHGRPAHTTESGQRIATTNGGLWASNGPIYVDGVFELWLRMFFNTMLISALMAGLARPGLTTVQDPQELTLEAFVTRLMDWHPAPRAPGLAAVVAQHLMP